jgi:endonuclease/exonuclease/phosphatase family metal-dependent hydrolase
MKIVTLNCNLAVGFPLKQDDATKRAKHLVCAIGNSIGLAKIDVLAVQECIVGKNLVKNELRKIFPYCSKSVKYSLFSKNIRVWPSGIAMFSKWPIIAEKSLLFKGAAYHSEHFMAKGCVYMRILYKRTTPVSIFSTHLQAWDNIHARSARVSQARQMSVFIDRLNIPINEPIFVVGDFNTAKIETIENILKMSAISLPHGQYTFDSVENVLVGTDDHREYVAEETRVSLDWIMTKNIAAPVAKIVPILLPFNIQLCLGGKTVRTNVVTDHSAVVADVEIPEHRDEIVENVDLTFDECDGHSFDQSVFITIVVLSVVIFVILFILIWSVIYIIKKFVS